VRILSKTLLALLVPLIKGSSTPKRAGKVIANAVINATGETGVYFDERGQPMRGSTRVNDPAFQDRVVAETRAWLPCGDRLGHPRVQGGSGCVHATLW
jgi:hypothetical protein